MVNKSSYQKRKINNIIALSLASFATVLGIFFLFWILGILLFNGLSHISWEIFSVDGAPPGIEPSGLRHALVGHLMLTVSSTMIGVPMGLLAGTYLSEYGANSRFANFTRDISDIMMSAPSIIIGVFVYGILVMPFKQFSGWAGSIALAIIMIPVIIRTTDDMLALVPRELREAAYALGAPKWKVIVQIVYKGAITGITTGILLGVARVAGETAPLLFTAFNNNFYSMDMSRSIASLTVTMFNYTMSPFEDWQAIGWASAAILAFSILAINIVGRIIIKRKKR
ncbi:phosphate ABC transporter permease PstA [Sulfurospirillum cavolei]|jgi:phosphate transport system permease protein|uniref:phosphate ABC transporter permease PstA n=1 Tax=Sulfurospirillum cavolei TaxID=366522 RepID=UPI0005A5FEDB|nr:phosphate ABC transporter permease PstA [Sulfurospirillum cavolei]